MKDLWLIRHAESLANIGEATSTPREIPLSDNGLQQAVELADSLTSRPDLVIVSPYIRTQQTAEPLMQRFPDVRYETLPIQEFTYLSISRCRGTNSAQRRPWVEEYWNNADPNYCDGDQSESFVEFLNRVDSFVREMTEREFELAFAFTHEQVIKALIWRTMNLNTALDQAGMKAFYQFMVSFKIPNAATLQMKIDGDELPYFGKIQPLQTYSNA